MSRFDLKIIPDVVWLAAAGLMWLVSALTPPLDIPAWPRLAGMLALLSTGLGLVIMARVDLARAGTTFNPTAPDRTSNLVTSGVYRFTRNPMYLGMLLALFALAVWLSNPYSLALTALFVVYVNRFQIEPEERVLRVRFGPTYDAYVAEVRRWI
ncbi:MAG TPA: isoprenylcysteine carboxylmethyltransferase family protein [Coriobacteriia bacterium]